MDKSVLLPIEQCADILQNYIAENTGKLVKIRLPLQPHEYDKFILAFNIACVYYNLTIKIQ